MDSHEQLTTQVVAVMAEAIRAAMERATATMLESPDNQLNPEATRSGITFLMLTAAHDSSWTVTILAANFGRVISMG
jgi:hypothetical protein